MSNDDRKNKPSPTDLALKQLDGFKEDKRLRRELGLDRIRAGINRMIEQQLQDRGR
ncbi:MAG TPA: hypothetical protein VGH13_12890 [Xanthobacteraceae bacterium]|jgi:hypothetical protein